MKQVPDIYLQIFDTELWPEFKYFIISNQLLYNNFYIGLYENQNNDYILNDTKNIKNCYYDIFPNKGGDIGCFLCQFKKYSVSSIAESFIKIHSKKSILNVGPNNMTILDMFGIIKQEWWPHAINWRADLLHKLMGDKETFDKNIELLYKYNIGMVCPFYYDFDGHDQNNKSIISYLLQEIFLIDYKSVQNTIFPAGSMFISLSSIFQKYFTTAVIDKLYDSMPSGVIIDTGQGSVCHALERIFGYIITAEGLRIRSI